MPGAGDSRRKDFQQLEKGLIQQVDALNLFLNDIYGDKVAARIAQNAKGKEKLRIFIDHVVPSDCPETDAKQVKLREFAEKNGIEFEEGQDAKAVMQEVLKNCKKVEDDCEIFL